MLTAMCGDAQVVAWEVTRREGPFRCPGCRDEVTLRLCVARTSHFAHRPRSACGFSTGESETHLRCKADIYRALAAHPDVTRCALERSLGTVRPDVSARIRGIPVAIEVQRSSLTLERIAYRTAEYAAKRVAVLWVLPEGAPEPGDRLLPRLWERWIHAAYFGRVYFAAGGRLVAPVHLAYETRTLRAALPGPLADLATDFAPRWRSPWSGGALEVPASLLWVDTQPAWWAREWRTAS